MAPVVACIHHLEQPFLGHAEASLRAAGVELVELRDGALPALADIDAIVSFGGAQSAVGPADQLQDEMALLRAAVDEDVPVLGICLGGQVLAAALGAQVSRARRRTVAWRELTPLPGTEADPLVAALPATVPALHWNEDVFELPEGAVELLGPRSEGVEMFRFGECAWGLQFHPEVDAAALDRWYARYGAWLHEAQVTEREARELDRRWLRVQERVSPRLFAAFGEVVAKRAPARRRPTQLA